MSTLGSLILLFILLPERWCEDSPIRELDYNLEKGRLHSKLISHHGPKLMVGAHWEEKIGTAETIFVCEMNYFPQDYHPQFMPQIEMRFNESYSLELTELNVNDYFVVTKKEIWLCTSNDEKGGVIGMSRIVTELVASIEINHILYHDGIEVTSKPYSIGARTAKIKEVKYYDNSENVVLRYDGKLILRTPNRENIPDKLKTLQAKPKIDGEIFKEVNSASKLPHEDETQDSRLLPHIILGVGLETAKVGDPETSIAECEKYQGDYRFAFRTQYNITFEGGGNPFYLTQDNYNDYITSIREETWTCKDNHGIQFWRIVNEFITTKLSFGKVYWYDEIIELNLIKRRNINAVRAEAVAYHDHNDPGERILYDGKIKLLSPTEKALTVLKSSREGINGEMIEFKYLLQPDRAFRSYVSAEGLNIRVGTKWTSTIGSANDIVKCELEPREIHYSFDFGTKVRLILEHQGTRYVHAIPRSLQNRYWEFIKQEVWQCKGTGHGTKYKFLRIVNKLKGKQELFEVEYYDGMQLYSRVLDGVKRSVNILEIKYVDEAGFHIYKYEGKIMLESPSESSKHNFINCVNCDGQPIMRTEDEIVFEVGTLKDRTLINMELLRLKYPLKKKKCNYRIWNTTLSQNMWLNFGQLEEKLIPVGSQNDVIVCKKINRRDKSFLPYITNLNVIPEGYNAVELIEQMAWLCEETNQKYKLYRVTNKYYWTVQLNDFFFGNGVKLIPEYERNRLFFDEIKYLTGDDAQGAKFEGAALVPLHSTVERIISGTVDVTDLEFLGTKAFEQHSNGPDIIYELDKKRIHKITVLESGVITLEIGMKWEKTYGYSSQMVQCDRNNGIISTEFREYKTSCKTYPDTDMKFTEDQLKLFDSHFILKNKEIWDCKDQENIVFRRIVTYFELKAVNPKHEVAPVKEIRYYDGVEVRRGIHASKEYGWFIKEVRYTHPDDPWQTIKYVGKLQLNKNHIYAQYFNEFETSDIHSSLLSMATRSLLYQLDNKNREFQTEFGPGLVLKVGTKHQKVINDKRTFSCKILPQTDSKYEMQVFIGQKERSFFKYVAIGTVNYITRTSQSWECEPAQIEPAGNLKLIRVVNRLAVSVPIAKVIYYDGVTVDPDQSSIQEIKFIDQSDNKVVKFDGFLILDNFPDYGMEIPPEKNREIDYILDNELTYVRKFKENGLVIDTRSKWTVKFGNSQQTAKCYLSVDETFDPMYRPRILSIVKDSQELDVEAILDDNVKETPRIFDQKRSAYECKNSQFGSFTKVVNLNIILSPEEISEIYYTDGITVWFDKYENKKALFIREVKFMKRLDGIPKVIKFEGKITNIYENNDRFKDGTSIELARPLTLAQYEKQREGSLRYKNHKKSENGGELLENIIFTPRGKDSTQIQNLAGLNIDVGTKWQKEVGDFNDVFLCTDTTEQYDKSKLMTRIIIHLDEHSMVLDDETFFEYFNFKEMDISVCSKGADRFLRVITEICGKSGIKQVTYFNGIKILKQSIGSGEDTALIIEQKYVDPNDYKVIKYIGKLEKK